MLSDSLSPRMAAMAGALALVPVAWYGVASSGTAGIFSAINVLIILAAMVLITRPAEGSDHHGNASA